MILVIQESGPAVVAFRGTDVNANTPGGQADLCIDYIMGGVPSKSLPKYCANFTAVELDYFSQAKAVSAIPHTTTIRL